MWYDVTGYEEGIEYQILDTTNETHIKVSAADTLLCLKALAEIYSAALPCIRYRYTCVHYACIFWLRQALILWLTACTTFGDWP